MSEDPDPTTARAAPSPLTPQDPVWRLPGITEKRRDALARLDVFSIEDLLRLAPRRYEDRRHPTLVRDLEEGQTSLVIGKVLSSRSFRVRGGMSILEATLADESGEIEARWFQRGFVRKPLHHDRWYALYGPVKLRGSSRELAGPQLERLPDPDVEDPDRMPGAGRIVPVHPLTTGLSAPVLRRAVWTALPAADSVDEPVPEEIRRALKLPPLPSAFRSLHFPDELEDAEAARRRLAFDELLVHEIRLSRRRRARHREAGISIVVDGRLDERIRARLPFRLTPGQDAVVRDIVADLACPHPMNRLVQGDVGSGKTAVAAYALLAAVARRRQGALMAPTDVLARQHESTLTHLLEGSRVRTERLSGGRRSKAREETLARIARGDVDLVIGTHAVLSETVHFRSLGVVVVDEQHKFGVRQRHDLVAKGGDGARVVRPHCLVMTATPIPRTLALTVYGDLDCSVIEGRPPGRRPVETWVVTPEEGRRVFERVRAELAQGRQAFVIYPLVAESDKLGLRDAVAGRERWAKTLPDHRVGLLHGRMKPPEKEAAMDAFREGRTQVLVATVVVEVGVDVPNATMLVVEHAERFGLSQLHQLRGRVGRGEQGGLCVLVDRAKSGRPARLEVLASTDDGFRIAEEDLKLRGTGDVLGTRQHGDAGFHAARLPRDIPLLLRAREAAAGILASDVGLSFYEHRALAALVATRAPRGPEPSTGG